MKGFFHASAVLEKAPAKRIAQCGVCGLYKTCKSPKMPVSGKGKRQILIVAEAPGADEDEQGIQLCGKSGKLLERSLRKFGIEMRRDCWLTNALICRPPSNRTPDDKEITYCQPNLTNTIRDLQPQIIIPLGAVAVKSLIGSIWRQNDVGAITRWVGRQIPCQKLNSWICPSYHPAYLLRANDKVLELYFDRYLEKAIQHKAKPYEIVPDYRNQIERVHSPEQAATIIDKMICKGGTVAIDYETNMLKPDWPDAEIISCAVCWEGVKTIAYPWVGEAIKATKRLWLSPLKKIAANLKFEDRWTRAKLGIEVNNWYLDTMVNAHVLDFREGVTGLKFQAFVLLGMESYDDPIKPYLKAKGDKRVNQILKDVDLNQLLAYNGLDALLEFKIAKIQRESVHGR